MFLLTDPGPPGSQQVKPDIPGIIVKPITNSLQSDLIVIDRASGDCTQLLLWKCQPIRRLNFIVDVEIEIVENEPPNCEKFYPVIYRAAVNLLESLGVVVSRIGRREISGIATKSKW